MLVISIKSSHCAANSDICFVLITVRPASGTFQLIVRTDMKLSLPRAEKPDAWITMGFDEDLDDAVKLALRDMIKLISRRRSR